MCNQSDDGVICWRCDKPVCGMSTRRPRREDDRTEQDADGTFYRPQCLSRLFPIGPWRGEFCVGMVIYDESSVCRRALSCESSPRRAVLLIESSGFQNFGIPLSLTRICTGTNFLFQKYWHKIFLFQKCE